MATDTLSFTTARSNSGTLNPHHPPAVEEKKKKFLGRLGLTSKRRVGSTKSHKPADHPPSPNLGQTPSATATTNAVEPHHLLHGHLGLALPSLSSFVPPDQRVRAEPISAEDAWKIRKSSRKSTRFDDPTDEVTRTSLNSSKGSHNSQLFTLDTDLDHMEGIVSKDWEGRSSGNGTSITGLWGEGSNSSQGSSSMSSRSGATHPQLPTAFTNPFAPSASNPACSGSRTPSSASASAKGSAFFITSLPRRPSQLRSMVTPSEELAENPFDTFSSNQTPRTEFRNPFDSVSLSPGKVDQVTSPLSTPVGVLEKQADNLFPKLITGAPPIRSHFQAWTAPESWGVEGDQEDESSDDEEGGEAHPKGTSIGGPSGLLDASRAGSRDASIHGEEYGNEEVDELDGQLSASGSIAARGGIRPFTSGSIASRSSVGGKQSIGQAFGRPSTGGEGGLNLSGGRSKLAVGPLGSSVRSLFFLFLDSF